MKARIEQLTRQGMTVQTAEMRELNIRDEFYVVNLYE